MKERARKLALVQPDGEPLSVPGSHEAKLAAAKAFLGARWRLHPEHDSKMIQPGVLQRWLSKRRRDA